MSEQHGHLEGNDEAVQAHLKRLRRIEGQVRGIQRMVEEEKYCIDILTQVSAATKALQALALGLLDDHMAHCLVDAARQGGAEAGAEAQGGLRRHRPPREVLTLRAPPHVPSTFPSHVPGAPMSETTSYTVTGMTCEHCAASVTEEISEISGVEDVAVVVETGAVTVTSATPLDESAVRAAVEEAGYALA